ncbi:dynein regulatory complex subunit 7 [Seriola lalandi dorsalis]|uniref:dynein regulatory complex subunit 7 n=1 Tax=Seriola lalandi dorsalis TaxID=1841481 RepID=UPI000C6F7F50|nr:dynein regulatory complex subunit 7 [Seriola lalandi dorsalis]XP_056239973.1 dynein regulatory complex subunit 7 isoform X1 [Seriola aureovittata]
METVLESDREEQLKSGETQEEEEKQDDRELEGALGNIHVSASMQPLLSLDEAYPKVYRINSPDEIRLLAIADNFQRQYSHLYPDRKPLLLCPLNECGVKKFVSTTLRPTPTIFPELFTWEGSASFVANFLSLEPLEPPVDPPSYLFSSTSVLQSQRATCFEFATMLCSLLLGADYDAYCVSGYAVKDMCLLDQSLQDCPLLDTKVKSVISEQESQHNKYTVKPVRELKSHFLTQQEKKKQEAEAALLQKQKLQEESEQRTADPLRGLRVHCWVLVLSGSRSVQKNFFIDPLTGISYSTDHENFLGIESVWNNLNYYVNMQDCRNGCADMMYDLEDLNMWEPVLFGATSKKQLILDVLKEKETKMLSKINKDEEVEEEPRVFEMPRSWVNYITISKEDLETRWPGGQKVTRYRKAKVEKFTAYLRPDGLVTRLMTYKDLDCTEVAMVKEWYQHRNDHLEEREVNKVDSFTTERFKRGRPFYLLFYRFKSLSADAMHEMGFSNTRIDNVVRRVVSPGEMTEIFEDRADFLHYRHVVFDRHIQISEPHVCIDPDGQLLRVVERFHRDRAKPANEDVAERVFLPSQRRIEVTYHLEDHRFIPSKRSFIKPRESTEQKKAEEFTFDLVSSFQVDPSEKPLKIHTLYEMLVALMRDEKMVAAQIEQSLDEVQNIVARREEEENNIQLFFSPWSTAGAARARSSRKEMERQALEEQRWLQEREKDILAVILIQLDKAGTLSAEDAKQLHQECLTTFKQKLLEHADLIQERYEKVTQELQKKQQWYQENQLSMTQTEEADYHSFCSEKTLQIHVTKKRLSMHKEAAPQKYLAFDQKLRRDPRLAPHLSN